MRKNGQVVDEFVECTHSTNKYIEFVYLKMSSYHGNETCTGMSKIVILGWDSK